jgi:hypothetical protein
VHTGLHSICGTSANVAVQLIGLRGASDVTPLAKPYIDIAPFLPGSVDVFQVAPRRSPLSRVVRRRQCSPSHRAQLRQAC